MNRHLPAHVVSHGTGQVITNVVVPVLPAELADKAADLRRASKALNTQRAYTSDWVGWLAWCQLREVCPMPAHADSVAAYLADKAGGLKVSTLSRHLATISKAHQVAGVPNPCRETLVKDTLAGLRKTYGVKQTEAPGLLADNLRATLANLSGDLSGKRDRALLLIGWSAGLRRSEIAALTWGDIAGDPDGLIITLAKSKTDQDGKGRIVGIAKEDTPDRCPVAALNAWREAITKVDPKAIDPGAPIFIQVTKWGGVKTGHLTGQAIAKVIERRTAQAGLLVRYQGHSLRKGLVQTAFLAGVSDSQVMKTTGHKSVTMLVRYQGGAGVVSRAASKGLLA